MRINTNLSALSALNSLKTTNSSMQKIITQLSTGLRINSASDDAAGFAVSEKMRAQISGLDAARRNAQDGISLMQTAEGALGETNSMLQRMRELAVQASNDSLTSQDRSYVQLEVDELRKQIDRIADTTQFNRKKLLNGSCGALWSSDNTNVKAKINGGLISIDEFGQKINAEGNYRLEVKVEPGQAQVQKSNIINLGREEVITKTETVHLVTGYTPHLYEININNGVDSLGKNSGEGWKFESNTLTITEDGTYCIVGNSEATQNHILVNSGIKATIFLRDVNIDVSENETGKIPDGCAFYMKDATVDMYLDGDNTLSSGDYRAGIEVSAQYEQGVLITTSNLTISSISGDYSTDGTLKANGGIHGAGIGGGYTDNEGRGLRNNHGGNITIKGGTIEAKATPYLKTFNFNAAAGIGGGGRGIAGNISIEGGKITATGGTAFENILGGAGIGSGGGSLGDVNRISNITIKRGEITANSGSVYSAGIGGGTESKGGHIEINTGLNITTTGYIEYGRTESIGGGHQQSEPDDINYISMTLDPARTIPNLPVYDDPNLEPSTETAEQRSVTNSTLADITTFYNSDGVFLVQQPQTISITQGDGKTAKVTLYETDTMKDVARKINDAIANSLGQKNYVNNPSKFCTIASGQANTSESVFTEEEIYFEENEEDLPIPEGSNIISRKMKTRRSEYDIYSTMLIRSAVPGKSGELSFSGSEDLLQALGLNTIQESSESEYTLSVYNAHSGVPAVLGVKSTGNFFRGVISPNVDIEVDPMPEIIILWDEENKCYIPNGGSYSTILHLKNNSSIFQTGANQGEDFLVQLGDASCEALGLSAVNLTSRETASRSISLIDRAINKISSQRARIGASENALELTMNNLTTQSLNLTQAESRIRDADILKSFMEFVKLQILNQSGTSMLAQANQLPQSILSIL